MSSVVAAAVVPAAESAVAMKTVAGMKAKGAETKVHAQTATVQTEALAAALKNNVVVSVLTIATATMMQTLAVRQKEEQAAIPQTL